MDRQQIGIAVCLTVVSMAGGAQGSAATEYAKASEREWLTDYYQAYRQAKETESLLLIYFYHPTDDSIRQAFEQQTLRDAEVKRLSENFVRVKAPTTTTVEVNGVTTRLLSHSAFAHMNGQQGLAIIDLKHKNRPYYGKPVSCLPFEAPAYYAPSYWGVKSVRTLLALPPGSITQRTLTFAVRCHPERPASSNGRAHPRLFEASARHSGHQAQIRSQGHHNWSSRFHRIHHMVGGRAPTEVCAESWPGENLLRSCFSCVHCWRRSSGHWRSVSRRQPAFGYDIRRGSNGIWYATGIFGGSDVGG